MSITKYKTKKGVRWLAELYHQGKRIAQKAGFPTKRDAQRWERDQKAKLETATYCPSDTDFRRLFELYLDEVAVRRKRNTYIYKKSVIKKFDKWLGPGVRAVDITVSDMEAFLQKIYVEISGVSANRYRMEIGAIFNFGIKNNLCHHNPCRPIEKFPEKKFQKYVPPIEDIQAVMMQAQGFQRDFLTCLLYTGARQNEILELTWEDVNFRESTITLWTSKRRGGNREPRTLAMVPELGTTLKRLYRLRDKNKPYVFINPLTGNKYHRGSAAVEHLFRDLCQEAEVKHFTAHSIRHYVGTLIKDSFKDPRRAQKILGHMNLSTTEKYFYELDVDREFSNIFSHEISHEAANDKKKTKK